MKKIKEYHICDRCKKEIHKDEINERFDYGYHYELCDICKDNFDLFQLKVEKLKKKWEELEKEFMFGKYLPKEDSDKE